MHWINNIFTSQKNKKKFLKIYKIYSPNINIYAKHLRLPIKQIPKNRVPTWVQIFYKIDA
jgi:hypothetical protein